MVIVQSLLILERNKKDCSAMINQACNKAPAGYFPIFMLLHSNKQP